MTLSLLLFVLMMIPLVVLTAVLVVDAVRALRRSPARRAAPTWITVDLGANRSRHLWDS